jgi:hypothetical protein
MCDHQMGIPIFQKFEKIILTTTVIILKSSLNVSVSSCSDQSTIRWMPLLCGELDSLRDLSCVSK